MTLPLMLNQKKKKRGTMQEPVTRGVIFPGV